MIRPSRITHPHRLCKIRLPLSLNATFRWVLAASGITIDTTR